MSIFDEWQRRAGVGISPGGSGPFSVRRLDWGSAQGRVLSRLASSNNVLLASTAACTLVRWNLEVNGVEEEIEISRKPEDVIEHVFLDPSGHHAIIAMRNADNYYLHSRSARPKKLSRLPGGPIESIAFDRQFGSETATRSFLVGTKLGFVYEMSVDSSGKERVCQPVFQLDKSLPITSIHFETIGAATSGESSGSGSGGGGGHAGEARIFVLLATSSPTRLYNFLGGPTFQQLFVEASQQGIASFTELPRYTTRRTHLL